MRTGGMKLQMINSKPLKKEINKNGQKRHTRELGSKMPKKRPGRSSKVPRWRLGSSRQSAEEEGTEEAWRQEGGAAEATWQQEETEEAWRQEGEAEETWQQEEAKEEAEPQEEQLEAVQEVGWEEDAKEDEAGDDEDEDEDAFEEVAWGAMDYDYNGEEW